MGYQDELNYKMFKPQILEYIRAMPPGEFMMFSKEVLEEIKVIAEEKGLLNSLNENKIIV